MPCSGAAIRPELLRFFHAAGIFVNYGYGATETTATVSCFRNEEYDFDTCGTIMPDIFVKISEGGEILVKGKTVFKGYYKKTEATAEILKDGWYCTGDEGRIKTKDGLVMTDRIKDLMKTSVGKYVSPQKLELLLGKDEFIEQIITIGDNQKFVSALIVPAFEPLKQFAKSGGIEFSDHKSLIGKKEIQELFRNRIDQLQKDLTPYEKVKEFRLLHEPFSIENQAMTSTLKLRRKVISAKHKHLIEEIYLNA
jgi:long-chain acyl-CoA synthetase